MTNSNDSIGASDLSGKSDFPARADELLQSLESVGQPEFDRIWSIFQSSLRAYLRKRIGPKLQNDVGASDVMQSAFLSLWKRLEDASKPPIEEHEELWKLLITIARRKLSKRWRQIYTQRRGEGRIFNGTDLAADGSSAAGILETITIDEASSQITAEIDDLSECLDAECQTIVSMKLSGMTNEEIATALDCSKRRIERKNALIRKAFARQLADLSLDPKRR